MADGRMLHKKISLNEAVASLENDTHRLLFTWAISHLDIDGRISGSAKVFRAIVVPLLEHITSEKVAKFFKDAEAKELILRYFIGKEWFIQYPKFKDNQRLRPDREAPSKIPPPPDNVGITPGVVQEEAGSPPALSLSKDKLSLNQDKLSASDSPISPDGSNGESLNLVAFVYSCPHFYIEPEYFENLVEEYPGLTRDRILLEIKKAADWLTDNPNRHKRDAKGFIKNKRGFLRNWIGRAEVGPQISLPLSKADQVTAGNLIAAERVLQKWERKEQS